ncbi:histone H1 [Mucilaginibacter sp. FT3.2]|uniref:histone H1 n=1 Tax=Mucilaginibacter sp. FT3.2 TaxID=2723090 RepID=UPI001619513D|nr:histone H1 [Mucilaginibacter sp. FT3.2]MBB6230650.1 hypothetical protein [Mucilaginibacter sp. FT3.2]
MNATTFYNKGNKAACIRSKNNIMQLKAVATDICKDVVGVKETIFDMFYPDGRHP